MTRHLTRLQVPGFQVVDYLGKGARSTIWRVRERRGNRLCALKRVFKQPGDDDRFLDQALNEFRIARNFDHPAVRKYYRLRRLRRRFKVHELQLLMELCEGDNCQLRRPTDVQEIIRIFLVVAQAVTHIHSRGYLHGDIKPNNIIVAAEGTVKIIDFGQSCPIGTIKPRIQGTPDFIAPEQVYCRPLDARTDVFNFGAALYWTLTGRPIPTVLPKEGNGVQLRDDLRVTPPEEHNPEVPPALARLVLDCIELHPSRRPHSMRAAGARLELIAHSLERNARAAEQAPTQEPPQGPQPPPPGDSPPEAPEGTPE